MAFEMGMVHAAIIGALLALLEFLRILVDCLNEYWELPGRQERPSARDLEAGGLESLHCVGDGTVGGSCSACSTGPPRLLPHPTATEHSPSGMVNRTENRTQVAVRSPSSSSGDTGGPREFYAVVVGRSPGVYDSWADCHRQVNGFSENCYKGGFKTYHAAEEFRVRETIRLTAARLT